MMSPTNEVTYECVMMPRRLSNVTYELQDYRERKGWETDDQREALLRQRWDAGTHTRPPCEITTLLHDCFVKV